MPSFVISHKRESRTTRPLTNLRPAEVVHELRRFPRSLSTNFLGYRSLAQKVNVGRDSLDLRRIENPVPTFHPTVGHSLADDGKDLLGTIAILPYIAGEVSDRRSNQLRGKRAVPSPVVAMASDATRQIDHPSAAQQWVPRDLWRRRGRRLS
jgi:hypothetical protein